MTASQVKNRKSKFFALTQIKIDGETRVHQRRRKNHQEYSNLIDKSKSKLTRKEQVVKRL